MRKSLNDFQYDAFIFGCKTGYEIAMNGLSEGELLKFMKDVKREMKNEAG